MGGCKQRKMGERTRSSGERGGPEARMECAAAENPEEQRPHGGRRVRPRTQGGPAQWTHAYRGAVGTAVWPRAREFGGGGGEGSARRSIWAEGRVRQMKQGKSK